MIAVFRTLLLIAGCCCSLVNGAFGIQFSGFKGTANHMYSFARIFQRLFQLA